MMNECSKCGGTMAIGTAYCDYGGTRMPVQWVDGEAAKSLLTGLSLGGRKPHAVRPYRCMKCGFIEVYATPSSKGSEVSAQLATENAQLKQQMAKLMERVAVLETIATDPAERTAREIESLRSPTPPKDEL
jgi:hypothetical protein